MVTSPVTSKKQRSQSLKPAEKWCPMARLALDPAQANTPDAPANRWIGGMARHAEWQAARCLGTACAVFIGDDATGRCGLIRG